MKCLINCSYNNLKWVNKYFKGVHPYLLKVANKPLIEYYIDYCILNKITDIRIISDHKLNELESYLSDGSERGVSISYLISRPGDKLQNILKKNKRFIDDDIMVISGYIFIDYDAQDYAGFSTEQGNLLISESVNGKIIFLKKDDGSEYSNIEIENFNVTSITSVKDYFDISMDILRNKNQESEDKIVGGNVNLKKGVIIRKGSIIGDNVIIDSKTRISNSIIYDNTYVGSNLVFENKVLFRNCLIDPVNDEIINLADKSLVSEIAAGSSDKFYLFFHKFTALILVILMYFPYIFISFFSANAARESKEYILENNEKMVFDVFSGNKKGILDTLFYKLSLDKFKLLLAVLSGKIYLCGNNMLENNIINKELLKEYFIYHPAVFTYNEYLGYTDDFTIILNDMYYANNISIRLDIKILIKCLIKNIFSK